MTTINNSQIPFWRRPSTLIATFIRLAVTVFTHLPSSSSPLVLTSIPTSWLFSPSLTSLVIKHSFTLSHVREALAIQNLAPGHRFSDAYAAHPRIQIPPLLLAALTPLAQSDFAELYLALMCLVFDLVLASMIQSIGEMALFTNRVEAVDQETKEQEQLPEPIRPPQSHIFAIYPQSKKVEAVDPLIRMESLPWLAARLYYWSPLTAISGSMYSCFQMLPGCFLVASLYEATRRGGSPFLSTFLLAGASYLELHHVVFLVPLIALPSISARGRTSLVVLSFAFWFACLQGLSYQLVGPTTFTKVLQATYGLGWRTIRPNLSVQWYLAMQLFARFRMYFGALLLGLPYTIVLPAATRLYKYPMVLVSGMPIVVFPCRISSFSRLSR